MASHRPEYTQSQHQSLNKAATCLHQRLLQLVATDKMSHKTCSNLHIMAHRAVCIMHTAQVQPVRRPVVTPLLAYGLRS